MSAIPGTLNGRGDNDAKRSPADVISATSPLTGLKPGEVRLSAPAEAPDIVARARAAQTAWFTSGLRHRIERVRALKTAMWRDLDNIVATIVAEVGKPPIEAMSEFLPSIELLAYYQRVGPRAFASRQVFASMIPHRRHWVERRPFGVVLVIAPWNFPLLLSIAPIAAALLAGNTVVYKPSEFATQTGEAIARAVYAAGIPRDVFQIVHGAGDLGSALLRAKPDKVAFTGSVATGRKVAAAAGELLIPVTLELGAKDAAIVLADADLDRAARGIAWGGMYTSGQACLSIERVYVVRTIADRFIEKLKSVLEREIRIGPGEMPGITMGAITTDAQLGVIDSQVREAIDQGARLIMGGRKDGRAYLPTLLTDVRPDMRLMRDETFGPVIAIVIVENDEEALHHVNSSPYGLTGSVWTRDRARGLALASRLQVGHASVNDHIMSASLPTLPWGGTKDTGYGTTRGIEGLYEMSRPQSLSIERFAPLPNELFWYPYTPLKQNFLRRFIRFMYAPTLGDKLRALFERAV